MAISFSIKNSEFRHKVEIQQLTTTNNEDNIPVENWETVRTCFAKITHQGGNEQNISNGLLSIKTTKFFIRYSNINLNSKTHRIVYGDQIYDIKYANNVQEANKYIQIFAEARE